MEESLAVGRALGSPPGATKCSLREAEKAAAEEVEQEPTKSSLQAVEKEAGEEVGQEPTMAQLALVAEWSKSGPPGMLSSSSVSSPSFAGWCMSRSRLSETSRTSDKSELETA